jgi:DNA (cytosine-5)-methyltransferase 1
MANSKKTHVFWIDLFSGAGGTTTGIHMSNCGKVIACVNHNAKAIESHAANHPETIHFVEDIRELDVSKLAQICTQYRSKFPGCHINLWASLECTNYSKAKGGLPRDADSRTLANHLFRYIDAIQPSYIFIENVREFMAWGPLNEKGRPVSMDQGKDYLKWVQTIKDKGYDFNYRLLNAADFGAYTSRTRYFGQFAKTGLPIRFPKATHAKDPKRIGFLGDSFKKWKAVREVLDLEDEGKSIFEREKPLVENTLNRIYAGLEKFVAKGEPTFIKKYYSGRPKGKVISIEGPAGTVTTVDGQAIVKTSFIKRYNGGEPKHKVRSTESPIGTITTNDRHRVVNVHYLTKYYGTGKNVQSVDTPAPTITTKDRVGKVFIMMSYSNGSNLRSIDIPAGTVVTNDKHNVVSCNQFLMNPQFASKGSTLDAPCFTLIARMDKKPPYLISANEGQVGIIVYESDSPMMIKIKEFMAAYGIMDIKMRMLKIAELKSIQGFPKDYHLAGSKTDQKKFIGNAVECNMAAAITKENYNTITEIAS